MRRRLVVMALAAAVVVSTPLTSVSAGGNVAPPGSRSHGLSYAERAADWWRWAIALPASGHPLFSEGNVDCSVGQSAHVWYLAGAFAPAPPADVPERTCDIPSGTALFLPLGNVDCSTLEADPFFGANEAELRTCVRQFGFTDLHASVDGAEIDNLNSFLVESPLFSVVPPVARKHPRRPRWDRGRFRGPRSARAVATAIGWHPQGCVRRHHHAWRRCVRAQCHLSANGFAARSLSDKLTATGSPILHDVGVGECEPRALSEPVDGGRGGPKKYAGRMSPPPRRVTSSSSMWLPPVSGCLPRDHGGQQRSDC